MTAYLSAYASAFGLRNHIRFRTTVERVEPDESGAWIISLDDGSVRTYRAVVVAIGLFWSPKVPTTRGASEEWLVIRTNIERPSRSRADASSPSAPGSRPRKLPSKCRAWRHRRSCPFEAARTCCRDGSAADRTTSTTSIRSIGCRGRCEPHLRPTRGPGARTCARVMAIGRSTAPRGYPHRFLGSPTCSSSWRRRGQAGDRSAHGGSGALRRRVRGGGRPDRLRDRLPNQPSVPPPVHRLGERSGLAVVSADRPPKPLASFSLAS
jgi:hypothetical protein